MNLGGVKTRPDILQPIYCLAGICVFDFGRLLNIGPIS
jgi:hypothetical protein